MECDRAALLADLRDAERVYREARRGRSVARRVTAAHAVKDLERELSAYDVAYGERLARRVWEVAS